MERMDLTPTWETAALIYTAVLENSNASPEGRATAREELVRLARMFDATQRDLEEVAS